jgi:hypothetical protein
VAKRRRLKAPPKRRGVQVKVLFSDAEREALQDVMTSEQATAAELFRRWTWDAHERIDK